jgi:hypothetical protein
VTCGVLYYYSDEGLTLFNKFNVNRIKFINSLGG